ncbi:MAG: ATP-dependent DNA helicase, partial [Dehalobacterium sp.]
TDFYKVKKEYKGRNKALDKILNSINKFMINLRKECGEQGYFITVEKHRDFIELIDKYTAICELMLKENRELSEDNDFLQLYFEVSGFKTISDFYDERYVTFVESQRDEVTLKLFCLDPSFLLGEALKRGGSAIMFSATLSPLSYFRETLGGGEEDNILSLDSPFDNRSLCVMIADNVSTKYNDREQSRQKIARLIGSFVLSKTGNYIIYFPSYKYMNDVFEEFTMAFPDITAVKQGTDMSEEQREKFLSCFKTSPKKTYVAFCVLGGIFSEGIDLKGSRLIGAAIVSVGLPQLSIQQNIIRDYFNSQNGMGYEYAYMYPGMNKVLQAAGRVIRCESDIGAILLIDERYSHKNYLRLFPKHWHSWRNIKDSESLEKTLEYFWIKCCLH